MVPAGNHEKFEVIRMWATILVGAAVLVIIILAVRSIYRDKKAGKPSCGGNCGACGGCALSAEKPVSKNHTKK